MVLGSKFTVTLCLVFVLIATAGISQNQVSPDAVLGTYWSPTKNAKIEIYKSEGRYFCKTIWTQVRGIDTLNPDPKKQTQSLLGLVFLTDFVYENGKYVDGEIYDPQNGKIYSCKMWLEAGNLKARCYIGISLFGRTEEFESIE